MNRLRLQGAIDDETVATLHEETARLLTRVSVVALDERIRRLAAGPMPTVVGTLDALHLATALRLRDEHEPALVVATHDRQLAIAARAHGVPVVAAESA